MKAKKWEDTFLSNGKLLEMFGTPDFTERQGKEAQAQISFGAGRESRKKEIEELMDYAFKDGENIGRSEVVETTIYLALANGMVSVRELFELHPEGKAQLKKWGIK